MYIEGDVPNVVTSGNGANSGFGFGNNDAWVLIILFALIFGWNGNGWNGNNGGGSTGAVDGYVLTSDFANIERKIDGVNQGLCDGFYAMNTGMLNGFANVTNAITTGGYETRNAISDLSSQLASCCCNLQSGQKDTQYAIAMQTNALQQYLCDGFRSLHDEITANRIEDKNAQITAQQNEINALRLRASQTEQNSFLISQLGAKTPIPAYVVSNPYCCTSGCGTCGSVV